MTYLSRYSCESGLMWRYTKWELFVLSRLGWDLSCVTPLDFLELLLIRLPIRSTKYPDLDVDKVRQHAQAFISLAAKVRFSDNFVTLSWKRAERTFEKFRISKAFSEVLEKQGNAGAHKDNGNRSM
uniref:Cyclin N-terminal domain-containing protein n=1 Tax=Glossina austeni TaxID=7395 RepID=A0A1A9VSX1_GLOAU